MSYIIPANATPSKILYIDSRDANSYLATNSDGQNLNSYFQYILTENIEIPTNQRALVSLNSATIPYSFYNIREGVNDVLHARAENTTLDNEIETVVGGTYEPLTIPAGNYNAYSLITIIMTWFNDTFQDAGQRITYTLTMTYNTDKQKYLYHLVPTSTALGNGETIRLTFRFLNYELLSPHIEMGFGAVNVLMTTTGATAVETYSTNVVDINGSIHGVYIRTNLVSNGTLDSQNGTFSNILARVPINVQSGGIIFATPNNGTHRSIVDLAVVNVLTISLTDERNRILDLNGLHFQLAIAIDFLYAEKPIQTDQGGASESQGGDSCAVVSDKDPAEKMRKAKLKRLQDLEAQQKEERQARRRGPGRPRRVGRPRGSTNTKIEDEEE